jgi:endonuclease I
VVDDFGVKYVGKRHADHLVAALKDNYQISEDWEGKLYCGITLEWDYKNRTVDLSMPGYIEAALHKYQHLKPQRKQHAPH